MIVRFRPALAVLFAAFIAFPILPAGAATTARMDVVVVIGAGETSVSIGSSSLNMGTLTLTETRSRFSSGPVSLNVFSPQAANLVVYTENAGGVEGLVGDDGTSLLPLRIWTANLGAGTGEATPPDPSLEANWSDDNTAVWLVVRDRSNSQERPLFSDISTRETTQVDMYLAVDAFGVTPQRYQSGVVFEVLNQ